MITIEATPVHILFDSDDYQVVVYKDHETKEKITVTGSHLPVNCAARLTGEMTVNKKYGEQLKVTLAEEILPKTPQKIVDYLVLSRIKYVGKITAKRIVDKYGEQTYAAMEEPEQLVKVRGISLEKATCIAEEFKSKKELRKYIEVLADLDVPSTKISAIYKKFSKLENGLILLKTRPYMLCYCDGISFGAIDSAIKKRPEYQSLNQDRIRFGIMEAFYTNERMGHVFMECETCMNMSFYLLNDGMAMEEDLRQSIRNMVNQMVREKKLVYQYRVLYRTQMYEAETFVAERLIQLKNTRIQKEKPLEEVKRVVMMEQETNHIHLSDRQIEGIEMALTQNISIVTGGPGRGKTTLLKVLIDSERKLRPNNSIVLCAPTGRAARKMYENTGEEASTIHHLLGIWKEDEEVTELEELDADVLIIDEMSMCSMVLMYKLMSCIRTGTRIIFVGDKEQLPSVECGNVFSDMILSRTLPTVVLDTNFRQKQGSSIIENGDKILANQMPMIWDSSSRMIETYTEKDTLEALLSAVNDIIDRKIFHANMIQILTPYRKKTELGSVRLNGHLQKIFNPAAPDKNELKIGDKVYRVGDRVIHLNNEEEVSNGDIGYITYINVLEKEITVNFETNIEKVYSNVEFSKLEHAYALTIHKAQGSEYPCVIIPFIDLFGTMRLRSLLYTAVTRAKNFLGIVGNENSIAYAANNLGEQRKTYLAYRLLCQEKGRKND